MKETRLVRLWSLPARNFKRLNLYMFVEGDNFGLFPSYCLKIIVV